MLECKAGEDASNGNSQIKANLPKGQTLLVVYHPVDADSPQTSCFLDCRKKLPLAAWRRGFSTVRADVVDRGADALLYFLEPFPPRMRIAAVGSTPVLPGAL